jgi:outer membrane protein assembly factor BamB
MGAEFYRVGGDRVEIFNYIRGSCVYGVMPCNGLLYKPPDSCACYYQSKLGHLCALSPAREPAPAVPEAARLVKGPAYGQVAADAAPAGEADWPMYRRDAARSGFCPAPVAATVKPAWTADLGGRLTPPVAAFGKVVVAAKDRQTVYALDAATGEPAWTHRAGGRIDSAPTLHRGTVLFGAADGWVTCLRAADGALAWRYRVAPADRQIVSYQQVESTWPVSGSVLVVKDVLYALAGRNLFFDGGMRLVRLNPATGALLSEVTLDEKDPESGKHLQELIVAKYMPIANADILSSDGKRLYLQEQNFDLEGKRIGISPTQPKGGAQEGGPGRHLFCQTGLLDDLWFHRSYWIYGTDCGEGWGAYAGTRRGNPAGRILALDGARAYAFRSDPLGNMLHPRQTYTLYACDREPGAAAPAGKGRREKGKKRQKGATLGGRRTHWEVKSPPLLVNAMALGGKTLVVAGPPDLADETKMLGYLPGADDAINRQLAEQEAAWRGERGGVLWAVSAGSGEKQAELKLETIPVFDGMATANGKVYVSLQNGKVVCLK